MPRPSQDRPGASREPPARRPAPARDRPLPTISIRERHQLLERVTARLRARHLSPRTARTYLGWIRRYLTHFGRTDPASMGTAHVEAFLDHLARTHQIGAASHNQAASSIAFLYREMWGVDLGGPRGVPRAKVPTVLPRYSTPSEIERVLGCLTGPARVAGMIMYGSGTRLAETAALRLKDLDLRTLELTVRSGKGARDRTTVVGRAALPAIRQQIECVEEQHTLDLEAGAGWAARPGALHRKDPAAGWELGWQFLFPSSRISADPRTGRRGRRHLHVTTLQRALKAAVRKAGVTRTVSAHVLRHCFATEMIRGGCEIRTLQRLMGHRDLKTTARYLHVLDRPGLNLVSPLDRLEGFGDEGGAGGEGVVDEARGGG